MFCKLQFFVTTLTQERKEQQQENHNDQTTYNNWECFEIKEFKQAGAELGQAQISF